MGLWWVWAWIHLLLLCLMDGIGRWLYRRFLGFIGLCCSIRFRWLFCTCRVWFGCNSDRAWVLGLGSIGGGWVGLVMVHFLSIILNNGWFSRGVGVAGFVGMVVGGLVGGC